MSRRGTRDYPTNHINNDGVSTINGGDDTYPPGSLDNFIEIRETEGYLADKSMLIDHILSDRHNKVFLFCRPRRFGKSVNLTMLDAFLNVKYKGNTWFDGMKISECREYDGIRNTFPVIYLDMRVGTGIDANRLTRNFGSIVNAAYEAHDYLETSERIPEYRRAKVSRILRRDNSDFDVDDLRYLSELLHLHHGVPAVVLIDDR